MRVVQLNFFDDPLGRDPEQLLRSWPSLVDVAECARVAGGQVTVIQCSPHETQLARNEVTYHFLPIHGRRPTDRNDRFAGLLRELAPEVLHVHGLDFARDVLALAAAAPNVPIILQDHASRVPRPWRRSLWRRGCAVARGIAFCSLDQALPFSRADLIAASTKIFAIPESSSHFQPGDREAARRRSGLSGDPILLWVGHLNANKDPLTVLSGVSRAVDALPSLQLYCCYGTAPQLGEVRQRIASDRNLRNRVRLLGAVTHDQVETLMQAADVFVLGSHREGSGYALIEALACGVPPVVTDIPSFRQLTASGHIGALWPVGDPVAMAACLEKIAKQPKARLHAETRAHFESELSFLAVGRKLLAAYRDVRHAEFASGKRAMTWI